MAACGAPADAAAVAAEPVLAEAEQDMPKQKGRLAKDYIILKKLGRGNFAVVRLLQRKADKKYFAAKIIKKQNLKPEELKTLHDEVKILKKLKHPNINALVEYLDTKHHLYMVLELLKGGELFESVVKKKRYTEAEAANVIRQVARACQYMHQRGVIHRDLKPENLVYLDKENTQICVTDFGLAKFVNYEGGLMKTACGTPGYVAPEILKQQKYDSQVDLWSIGVILYILLCGFPPFVEKKLKALYKIIREGKYSFPSPYWDKISAEAKDCVSKLLKVDPKKRLTATQLLQHDWITGKCSKSPTYDPKRNLIREGYDKRFKRYVLLNKLKRGVDMVLFLNRLIKLAKLNEEADEEKNDTELDRAINGDGPKVAFANGS